MAEPWRPGAVSLRGLGRGARPTPRPGQPELVYGRLTGGLLAAAGPVYPDFVIFSFMAPSSTGL